MPRAGPHAARGVSGLPRAARYRTLLSQGAGGLGWSAGALTLCGLAPNFGWFLFFRGLQGIGSALALGSGPALVTLSFDETERGKILGFYTMLVACSQTLGPLLGGALVHRWGWSAVYFFRVPISLCAALLVIAAVRRPAAIKPGQRFDITGAVTLTLALVGFIFALNRGNDFGWLSFSTLSLAGLAGGCLLWFIRHEQRCDEPVIDVSLFRYLTFTIANVAHVLLNMASFTIMLLVPYYLLNYSQMSVTAGGVLLALSPLGIMLASPLGGWLLSRTTAYRLSVVGLALTVCGLLGVSQWNAEATLLVMVGALLLQGVGIGLFQVANMDFVMGTIPRHQQGVAGSLTMATRTVGVVGGATGGALLFGFLLQRAAASFHAESEVVGLVSEGFLPAFQGTFIAATAVAALACGLMWSSRFTGRVPEP